jgi:group I intron endonuclease
MNILIYRYTNLLNGKVYVGKTAYTLAHRCGSHLSEARLGCRRPFHTALRKYGIDNFKIEVIDKANDSELAAFKEIFHIALNESKVPYGYNVTDGGEGAIGRVFTEEHKARISAASLGKPKSLEHRATMSAQRRGVRRGPPSPETKAKIAATLAGRPHSAERIERIRLGRWPQLEAK